MYVEDEITMLQVIAQAMITDLSICVRRGGSVPDKLQASTVTSLKLQCLNRLWQNASEYIYTHMHDKPI